MRYERLLPILSALVSFCGACSTSLESGSTPKKTKSTIGSSNAPSKDASESAGGNVGGNAANSGKPGTSTDHLTKSAASNSLSPLDAVATDSGQVTLARAGYAIVFGNANMTTSGAGEGSAGVDIDGNGCNADSIYATSNASNVFANSLCIEKLPAGSHQLPPLSTAQQVSSSVSANGGYVLIDDSPGNILASGSCIESGETCAKDVGLSPSEPALLIAFGKTRVTNSSDSIATTIAVDGNPCATGAFGSSGVTGQSYDSAATCAVSLTAGQHKLTFQGLATTSVTSFLSGYIVIPQSRVQLFRDLSDAAKTGTIQQDINVQNDGTILAVGNLALSGSVGTVEISVDGMLCGADSQLYAAPANGTSAGCIVAVKAGHHALTIAGYGASESLTGQVIVLSTSKTHSTGPTPVAN